MARAWDSAASYTAVLPRDLTAVSSRITVLPMPTITFKVRDEEARRIRAQARREGLSLSEYLRRRASSGGPGPRKPRRVRCKHTGALIFAPMEGAAPLTTDVVRALLSEFP